MLLTSEEIKSNQIPAIMQIKPEITPKTFIKIPLSVCFVTILELFLTSFPSGKSSEVITSFLYPSFFSYFFSLKSYDFRDICLIVPKLS